MQDILKRYLFNKGILVSENAEKNEHAFEVRFAMAKFFNVRITAGQELADLATLEMLQNKLGEDVPEPFYRGFPESVRELTPDELAFDQLLHYTRTYGFGDFSEQGHSVFEEYIERNAFNEASEVKDFVILDEQEAELKLKENVENLLAGTRPLGWFEYDVVLEFIRDYDYQVKKCASKDTAMKLLISLRDLHSSVQLADFLVMSDVIKLVDEINFRVYRKKKLNHLNLKNRDRKFITNVINYIFRTGHCDTRTCYEKKAIWCGLLHHIHYQPINEAAAQFVQCMRGKENFSVYAEFEQAMESQDIRKAVKLLKLGKGDNDVLRHMNYIVSRCKSEEDIQFVLDRLSRTGSLVLIQLLLQYANYDAHRGGRIFKFTRHEMLVCHRESDYEIGRRKSLLSNETAKCLYDATLNKLEKNCAGKLGRVYIDPAMENIALPIQETTASSGYGVLTRGSRIHIEEGKKVRAFTYWERVNDIDLSVMGLCFDGTQREFSWRSMYGSQSEAITFSGDETSGYNGGSEYFDIDLEQFKKMYPDVGLLIFCDNVYSPVTFSECTCRAGYMLRDIKDSGEVYEPKTVKSSFTVTCDSTFAYLFAIDLTTNDFVWLNVSADSRAHVAGNTLLDFLAEYCHMTSVINMKSFFTMLATEVVEDMADADVIVSDADIRLPEARTGLASGDALATPAGHEVEIIRSCDTERVRALMNA